MSNTGLICVMLDLGAEAILSVPVSSMSTNNADVVLFTDTGHMVLVLMSQSLNLVLSEYAHLHAVETLAICGGFESC